MDEVKREAARIKLLILPTLEAMRSISSTPATPTPSFT
jgi:hypothetical protein